MLRNRNKWCQFCSSNRYNFTSSECDQRRKHFSLWEWEHPKNHFTMSETTKNEIWWSVPQVCLQHSESNERWNSISNVSIWNIWQTWRKSRDSMGHYNLLLSALIKKKRKNWSVHFNKRIELSCSEWFMERNERTKSRDSRLGQERM
jgi:hypothetical protein